MLNTKFYSLLLGLVLICLFSVDGFSQGRLKDFQDGSNIFYQTVFRGDTVVVKLDSAHIMNEATLKVYREARRKLKENDPTTKRLIDDYERLIALQDSMLKSKEAYYQQLKASFDSLAGGSNTFLNKTSININAIDTSLSTVTNQLTSIRSLLDDSLEKLKQERGQRLKTAIKGFGVGVGVAALVFLITK